MSHSMDFLPIVLIAFTVVVSLVGFNNKAVFDRYKFNTGAILGESKQWDRIVTSAFLHADMMHLFFNMFTLYFFSDIVLHTFGAARYLILYFGAVIAGGLLSLLINRNNPNYNAIGASGGVVGILFAAIAINPHIGIGIFPIPFFFPGWIFAIAYLALSIYGMQKKADNVGHEAHLGGAAAGILLTLLFNPHYLLNNMLYIGLICIPLVVLAYYIFKKQK